MTSKHCGRSIVSLLGLIVFIITINGQTNCVFPDDGGTPFTLDLRALAHTELSKTDELTPPNTYIFTPCRNALSCEPDTAMALKTEELPEEKCTVLANYDNMQTRPLFDTATERWTFQYQTGNECGNSTWQFTAYFDCDPDIGDFFIIDAGSPNDCSAEMYISTHWACPGEVYTTNAPEELSVSGGSIFVIIVFGAAFMYLIFGWMVCAIKNRNDHALCDFEANIPHITFWMKMPALVIAGCTFSRDFMSELCCGQSVDRRNRLIDEERDVNPFAQSPTLPVPSNNSSSLLDTN